MPSKISKLDCSINSNDDQVSIPINKQAEDYQQRRAQYEKKISHHTTKRIGKIDVNCQYA